MKGIAKVLNREIKKEIQESRSKQVFKEQRVKESRFKTTISVYFGQIDDLREPGKVQHKLIDIIRIAICAVLCGANNWTGVETYGKAKEEWLRSFLELPNGIPSQDTFNNVFNKLLALSFQECFINWA